MSYLKNDDYEKDKAELLKQFNVYKSIVELINHEINDERTDFFLKFTNKMINFVQQSKWNGDTKTEETCSDLMSSYEMSRKANRDTFFTLFNHLNDKSNEHYKGHFLRLQEVIERVEKREEFLAFWTFGCTVLTVAGLLLFFLG